MLFLKVRWFRIAHLRFRNVFTENGSRNHKLYWQKTVVKYMIRHVHGNHVVHENHIVHQISQRYMCYNWTTVEYCCQHQIKWIYDYFLLTNDKLTIFRKCTANYSFIGILKYYEIMYLSHISSFINVTITLTVYEHKFRNSTQRIYYLYFVDNNTKGKSIINKNNLWDFHMIIKPL